MRYSAIYLDHSNQDKFALSAGIHTFYNTTHQCLLLVHEIGSVALADGCLVSTVSFSLISPLMCLPLMPQSHTYHRVIQGKHVLGLDSLLAIVLVLL